MRTTSSLESTPVSRLDTAVDRRGWLSARAETIAVAAVLTIFLLLGLGYSLRVPLFETPDEVHHYAFARHLAQGHPLPVQTVESTGPWEHEGTQAPLYYLLLGRLIAGIDQSDFDAVRQINPHANLGNPLYPGNKNYMLYSAQPLPLAGTNLAVHVGRWFSLVLAVATLLLVYAIARLAFPGSRRLPLFTLCAVAAIPQFQFISATVSNDNMVILSGTATLFWLARLVTLSPQTPVRWVEWMILGGLLGLAALSKLPGLGLVLLAALVVLWLAWLHRDWRLPLRALLPTLLPLLFIAGWWYWRNYTLYGEWLGMSQLLSINGAREAPRTLAQLWGELRGVRYSFWGLFGWFSILMPGFVYTLLDGVVLLAVAGLVIVQGRLGWVEGMDALHRPATRVHLLLLTWAAMLVALLIYWLTFATSGQGRLLFPAVAAFGVFLVMGISAWLRWLPARWQIPLFVLLPVGLLLASLHALLVLLPHSYAATAPVDAVPAQASRQGLIFGEKIELVAVEIPPARYRPGDRVDVTLYWRALAAIEQDHPLFVQLLDRQDRVLGNVTSHAGWGRFPTSFWEPEQIYPDRYQVQIERNIDNRSPLLARLAVGFLAPNARSRLSIRTGTGQAVEVAIVGAVDVVPQPPLAPDDLNLTPGNADFAGAIRLAGYQFPDVRSGAETQPLVVTLLWEATGALDADYTAFVHLIDANGAQISGFDQPPAEGRFPTSRWQAGDRSLSTFPLPLPADLPPGIYEVWAGLYADRDGFARLPVHSAGHLVQDQRILLGTIRIQ